MDNVRTTILVCEPTDSIIKHMRMIFRTSFYDFLVGRNLSEFEDLCEEVGSALLLFDESFEPQAIAEFVSGLGGMDENAWNYFIFVSATRYDEFKARIDEDRLIAKPIDPFDVYKKFQQVLEQQPRADIRAPITFPVKVVSESKKESFCMCISLSEGGIFIATDDSFEVGSVKNIVFELPIINFEINADVKIVHCSDGVHNFKAKGAGAQFLNLDEKSKNAIRHFISQIMFDF